MRSLPPALGQNPVGQADQFTDPHACGVEHFQKRPEADAAEGFLTVPRQRNVGFGLSKQTRDVIDAEDLGQGAGFSWRVDHAGRVIVTQTFGMQELVELAQRRQASGL